VDFQILGMDCLNATQVDDFADQELMRSLYYEEEDSGAEGERAEGEDGEDNNMENKAESYAVTVPIVSNFAPGSPQHDIKCMYIYCKNLHKKRPESTALFKNLYALMCYVAFEDLIQSEQMHMKDQLDRIYNSVESLLQQMPEV